MFTTCDLETYHPHSQHRLTFVLYVQLAATITLLESERRRLMEKLISSKESVRRHLPRTGKESIGPCKVSL
jgi:glucose-6-phosphate-specific signal transduction histidine kinase